MSGTLELGSDWQVIGNNNGDTVVKHIPSGTTHTLGSDGTLTTDALDTDEANVTGEAHVGVSSLDKQWYAHSLADDGTHYALYHDGTDLILYAGSGLPSTWKKTNQWSGAVDSYKRELHITANGSLLIGVDGSIYRSTDGGASFSAVATIPSQIWSFDEDSVGNIYASSNSDQQLFQSTDDGASWAAIADGTTFGNFPNHIHKVRVNPHNDWVIVTGGDGGSAKGFYRSTDAGTSWDHFETGIQMVGIGFSPTDGQSYLLGTDDANLVGVWKVSDDGTASGISARHASWTELREPSVTNSSGPFSFTTFTDAEYLLGNAVGMSADRLITSVEAGGENWRFSESISAKTGLEGAFSSVQGPHKSVTTTSNLPFLVAQDRRVSTKTAANPTFGAVFGDAVDKRSTRADVTFGDRQHRLTDDHGQDLPTYLWKLIYGSYGTFQIFGDSTGKVTFEDTANNTTFLQMDLQNGRMDAGTLLRMGNNQITQIESAWFPQADVRALGSVAGQTVAVHDGSGTNTAGPAWQDSSGSWISLVDGTTIS